jgi:peptidoglycan/LPS O-acetylase OafA/YrhL
MIRLLLIPLMLALAAMIGYGALRATDHPPYLREMTAACVPSFIAGIAALLPALLRRRAGQAAVVEGAFHGMVIHLALTVMTSLAIYLLIRGASVTALAAWLLWFFWVALAAVAWSLIRIVRTTPIAASE